MAVLTVIHYNMEDVVVTTFVADKADVRESQFEDAQQRSINEFRRQKAEEEARKARRAAAQTAKTAQNSSLTEASTVTVSKQ